ncbi:hypothetical protein JXL19_08525 [bacterium]|nr:hypothetical protein [bacterium]
MRGKDGKDSVWKEAIETYFNDFLEFFFPQIADDIAFERGYDFLDKELKRIIREGKTGKRHADLLVKVYLKDGQEKWLLVHIEVQGYYEKGFAERMFICNYRIFDRYRKEIISLAILADDVPGFRPEKYETSRWGFRHFFQFPTVKLIDYKGRWEELEGMRNPFAIIVMAHMKEMETKKDMGNRRFWKVSLVKRLYGKGYKKEDILLLYKFIDWLIFLPDKENERFHEEVTRYEEEKKMPYITTAEKIGVEKGEKIGIEKGEKIGIEKGEKIGVEKGKKEDIVEVLETRFGTVSQSLLEKIKEARDDTVLSSFLKKAVLAKDIEEFEQFINKALN